MRKQILTFFFHHTFKKVSYNPDLGVGMIAFPPFPTELCDEEVNIGTKDAVGFFSMKVFFSSLIPILPIKYD
jgi:hypothetical protein